MKNIAFILSIVMLFLTSCEPPEGDILFITTEYSNKSSKDISIISYHYSHNRKSEYTHKIEKGGKFEQKYEYTGSDYLGIINESDSVKVIFDNERQSTFVRGKDIENPYNIYHNKKKIPNKGEEWHLFTEYTFTDKDYEYAKPCNGKCN